MQIKDKPNLELPKRMAELGAYDRYTSTSSLAGVDKGAQLQWSIEYFSTHFETLLPSNKQAQILDLGCGYGKNIRALLDLGYSNCFGIDISVEQIAYAKSKLGLENVELADALDWLTDKHEHFDVVMALDVLEHLSLKDLLLLGKQIYSSLKPNGLFVLQVPNGLSPMNPFIFGDLTHHRAFTRQSLQQFFLLCEFTPINYFEAREDGHSFKNDVRSLLWKMLFRPAVRSLVRVLHGSFPGSELCTANIIAIAKKV